MAGPEPEKMERIEALEGYVAICSDKESRCKKCCFEWNSDQCLKMLCYEEDRKSGRSVYFLMNANKTNELEAEVSRLTEENKLLSETETIEIEFSEKETAEIVFKLHETIARLTEENEKLKREPGINVSEVLQEICAIKAELDVTVEENEKQRARIAELEEENERLRDPNVCMDCSISRELQDERKKANSLEARISAIEKWLGQKFQVIENGKIVSEFKPGGKDNG